MAVDLHRNSNQKQYIFASKIDPAKKPYGLAALLGAAPCWVSLICKSMDNIGCKSTVQEHLFPKGADSPGAQDINALPFLQFVITQTDFDTDSRNFIVNSIQSLEEASMERFDLGFEELDFTRKERLLRYLADHTRWGKNWISLLLYYIFEALLADPVYGCNPDGTGWQWLEHQPGFPRPPPDKIYTRIMARR